MEKSRCMHSQDGKPQGKGSYISLHTTVDIPYFCVSNMKTKIECILGDKPQEIPFCASVFLLLSYSKFMKHDGLSLLKTKSNTSGDSTCVRCNFRHKSNMYAFIVILGTSRTCMFALQF